MRSMWTVNSPRSEIALSSSYLRFGEAWCLHHSRVHQLVGKQKEWIPRMTLKTSGVKVHGCGANRGGRKVTEMEIDYYLAADKAAVPSIKFRQKNELTRQRTSENRLYELHFSAFPHAINDHLTPRTAPTAVSENCPAEVSCADCAPSQEPSGDAERAKASPRVGKQNVDATALTYPVLRSTNQVFNDVVTQTKQRLRRGLSPDRNLNDGSALPPHLLYTATYDKTWTSVEKADVKAARKLPYDSTLNSVVGRPKTIYRVDFCKKAQPEAFRDQIIPHTLADELSGVADHPIDMTTAASPRRPETARVAAAPPPASLRSVRVGSAVSDAPVPHSWMIESRCIQQTPPSVSCTRAASARVLPRPPASPRKPHLEVQPRQSASPREVTVGDGTFLLLPRSYFANRSKYTAT